MGKPRYILVLVIVLAIAFFTRWLLTSVEEPVSPARDGQQHNPDYFINNFTSVVYDKDGNPAYQFRAEKLEHFPDNNTMEITRLQMQLIDRNNQHWNASADSGIVFEKKNTLHLRNNVSLTRATETAEGRLDLDTEELLIDLDKRQATSSAKVKIHGQASSITAVGMKLDLKSGTLHLLTKATGHYEPR